jgi:glycosyltransferase involved in cell wall biosynthesis
MQTAKILCIDLRWIDSSGVGVYIKGIIPGLIEQLRDVSIVGLGNRKLLEEFPWSRAANLRLVDCRAGRYSVAEQIQLPLAIPSGVDLFFSPYYTVPLLYRGSLAVTVHDMSHMVVSEIIKDPKKRIYAQMMFRSLRKRASLIFTVSDFSKSELIRLTTGGGQDKIVTTHLGVSPEWYEAAKLPRVRPRPYVVCVGNVKPYKNIARLVEAFGRVRHRIGHDLVIIGQSEGLITGESKEFFEKVRHNGSRIEMTGFVSNEQLMSLVAHADALVMPSLYEGFGLPPLEAMAAGVPVAVAGVASLPEVCGRAALYFDPLDVNDISNKLVEIVSDPVLRAELGKRGVEHSRRFSWESCSNATSKALRTVLAPEAPMRSGPSQVAL